MSTPESRGGRHRTAAPPETETEGRFERTRAPATTDREGRFARTRREGPASVPPPGPPARIWRDMIVSASGLNALIGAWLIVAGFVLYDAGDAAWNAWWVGGVVLVVGLARAAGAYWQSWMSYGVALVGAWLFIASWVLERTDAAFWNDLECGAAIFILAVISASASDTARVADGRWSRR